MSFQPDPTRKKKNKKKNKKKKENTVAPHQRLTTKMLCNMQSREMKQPKTKKHRSMLDQPSLQSLRFLLLQMAVCMLGSRFSAAS